ncbi:hypothetical protein BC332_28077, partial [Capsicum chinense]
ACTAHSQVSQFKRLLGVKSTKKGDLKGIPILTHPKLLKLSQEFDAREAWPHLICLDSCLIHLGIVVLVGILVLLSHCLIVSVVTMAWQNISLSANDILACCGYLCGDSCDGGYPLQAWKYFVRKGVVTEV